jgi:hypothetical protein
MPVNAKVNKNIRISAENDTLHLFLIRKKGLPGMAIDD